jgi:hypothetical protein
MISEKRYTSTKNFWEIRDYQDNLETLASKYDWQRGQNIPLFFTSLVVKATTKSDWSRIHDDV